eukprot:6626104-Alexandrium_andersonii.AAC.1
MGVSSFCRFRAVERAVRALGEAQTAAFSSWAFVADSISAKALFRDVVVFTLGADINSGRRQRGTIRGST